jgi:fructuronate reductase
MTAPSHPSASGTGLRLSRATTGTAGVAPARSEIPAPGILHLGLGSFHRAHQAVYTDAAITAAGGDWGIVGVASRSRSVVDALREQDLLYTVAEISPAGTRYTMPAVHADAFVGADEPERVVRTLAAPHIRIVSLTVTENGYSYSPSTGHLDTADPLIAADLRGESPRSTIGQLVRGIQQRAAGSGAPLTVLSCDNLAENGRHTEHLVREFASLLPGSEGAEIAAFLDTSVRFPSSMVDRIVPATTDELRARAAADLGVLDGAVVPAEPFSMWAIEDDFATDRPKWEAGGAVFTDEVGRYEQLKMRLLNGTHSLIAYLGALSGRETIPDSIALERIEMAARGVLREEYEPSVEVPSTVDVRAYEAQLFDRWRNTALGHRTRQVGTDGSVKLRQRVPAPALALLDTGRMPHRLALTVAAYLSCVAPLDGFDPGPQAAAMQDAARARLAGFAATSASGSELARRAIAQDHLLGDDLAERAPFIDRVGELVDVVRRHGVEAAMDDCAQASTAASETVSPTRGHAS